MLTILSKWIFCVIHIVSPGSTLEVPANRWKESTAPPLTHAIDILGLVPILCRQYVKQSNDRSMYKVREGGEGVKLNMYFQPCKPWMLIILMDIYACMMKNINMMFYKHLQTGILPYLHDTNCVKKTFLKSDS